MLGAITGDIIGSIYEKKTIKTKDFDFFYPSRYFTDDSVLTIAIADAILHQHSYAKMLKQYCRNYPHAGYGAKFFQWGHSENDEPYYSYGNGSAMRVSPVAFAFNDLETVLKKAQETASVTHNHPEGIKGAQAIAASIFLARQKVNKTAIKDYIENNFNYNLSQTVAEVLPAGVACQDSVPQGIIAFLEANNFEETIRNAVYIGGDTDTIACMAGSIADAFYGVPESIKIKVFEIISPDLRIIAEKFIAKFYQKI